MKTKPNACSISLAVILGEMRIAGECRAEKRPRSMVCSFFERGMFADTCEHITSNRCRNRQAIISKITEIGGPQETQQALIKSLEKQIEKLMREFLK